MKIVNKIKKMNYLKKIQLAEEIRNKIIDTVSNTGGHLASNLGVVELTIALHSVFDLEKDKIVWDVGHQSYVHKLLTDRWNKFKNLRQYGGISGFPKTNESKYDCFNTGHSSTSISAACGIARARDIKGEVYSVIAVIGDGSLTGGLALEALNDVGASNLDITIILNDNEMSISKNTGGISLFLSKIRTKKIYINLNSDVKKIFSKIPILGKFIINVVKRVKKMLKQLFIKNMFFEDIGYTYLGPVDGHNIKSLEKVLKHSKTVEGPKLIHVKTKKGFGYNPALKNPDLFHAVSPFNIEDGSFKNKKKKDYSEVFGNKLIDLATKDNKIVAITAAMKDGTGLGEFVKKFPNRFFDVGIAEQHALCSAAGLAINGLKPYVPIYSSFLQRGYDQIVHDICMQKLPVTICIDRAGIVGNDGETHQGILDFSFLSSIPNMTIMAPKNFEEFELMLEFSSKFDGPLAIRYPRGSEGTYNFKKSSTIEYGKSELLQSGKDITIISIGKMVERAMIVGKELKKFNIDCEIINARFLKPLDSKKIKDSISKTKLVVTIEDNLLNGGLKSAVEDIMIKNKINSTILSFGYDDIFVTHGTVDELEKINGLDINNIVEKIKKNNL